MGIFSVTREVGGTGQPTIMTVSPPNAIMDPARSPVPVGLANFLSACLTQEREGVHLYKVVAGRAARADWRAKYEEFGLETAQHVEIYEQLIRAAGGDPMYVSPSARLVCFRATKLLEAGMVSGSFDENTLQLADLEAVMLAEQRCYDNWQLVAQIAEASPAGAIREALQAAVAKVTQEEEKHLSWSRETFRAAQLALATGAPPASSLS